MGCIRRPAEKTLSEQLMHQIIQVSVNRNNSRIQVVFSKWFWLGEKSETLKSFILTFSK